MKRFGFLRHYRRIRVEGINLVALINKCIKNDITMRNLRWHGPVTITFEIQDTDYSMLKKAAGHSYKMTVLCERGAVPVFQTMKTGKVTVIGAFLLGALIFYQSLFIAEITIGGYSSISETELRQTLTEAGVYEGARKKGIYEDAKALLYEKYDKITWISIYERGRRLEVDIAESGEFLEENIPDKRPVNIVAAKSGMIETILPLKGSAKVQKGDYVNEGDILISGRYRYQSSDYSKGDNFFTMYSHADGQVTARVPEYMTYYFEKNRRIKEPTGRFFVGIYLKFGDIEVDTASGRGDYEASVMTRSNLINVVKPLPFTLGVIKVEEVNLKERAENPEKIKKTVEAAVRQYEREELGVGERILSQNIDYSESVSLIRADVLTEVLMDIGAEKEIKVRKTKSKDNLTQ